MKTKAFYYDNNGNEVSEDKATHALLITYDDAGREIDSVFVPKNGYKIPIIGVTKPPSRKRND